MPITVSENGIVTVNLQDGRSFQLPDNVTSLGLSPSHDRFHSYYADSVVGFDSYEAWNNEFGAHVGRPFNLEPTTQDSVFMALRHAPAPENVLSATKFEGAAVNTGDTTSVALLGDVTHLVYPEYGVVVNITESGHALHPGIVVRQVVESNGIFSIITEGVGTGILPSVNEDLAGWVWSSDDAKFTLTGGVDTHLMMVLKIFEGREIPEVITDDQFCFLGDTAISMWPLDPNLKPGPDGIYDQDEVRAKIWTKPIRHIRVKDVVVAHDKNGNLVPDVVSRTFQNEATHILDFWGTGVTPGHAYLCGDGKREGDYAPLIDILRQDGAIVLENGIKIRAAINWPVGSLPDQFIWVLAGHDDGQKIQVTDKKKIRIGTRMIAPDGSDDCILDRLVYTYGPLSEDGYFENGTNVRSLIVHWPYGDKIPDPEDYILQRSDLTLEEIYAANEWEQIGTRMPPPSSMVGFNSTVPNSQAGLMLQASKPAPNIPPAFADHPNMPSGATKLNRKQRKAMEARKRKTARVKMRKPH